MLRRIKSRVLARSARIETMTPVSDTATLSRTRPSSSGRRVMSNNCSDLFSGSIADRAVTGSSPRPRTAISMAFSYLYTTHFRQQAFEWLPGLHQLNTRHLPLCSPRNENQSPPVYIPFSMSWRCCQKLIPIGAYSSIELKHPQIKRGI